MISYRLTAIMVLALLSMPVRGQWLPTSGATADTILCFASSGTTVVAGTVNGVYRSTDDGTSWTLSNTGLTALTVFSLNASGSSIFAGTRDGIFRSADAGVTWSRLVTSGLVAVQYRAVVALGPYLYAGTWGSGVYRSSDGGSNWSQINNGLTQGHVMALTVVGSILYAAAWGGDGVYWSSDSGASWSGASGLGFNKETEAIGGNDTLMVAVTNSGVFRSSDLGMNWVYANLSDSGMSSIIVVGSAVLVGSNWGVRRSSDGGITWSSENTGLSATNVRALGANSSYVFAGILGSGIWRRSAVGFVTSAETISTGVPTAFGLGQNYPNPFNPSTQITYHLPFTIHHAIRVYDLLGREIAVLVDDVKNAGSYSLSWNATGIPSGVYFYRLTAGEFSESRRLVLIR